MGSMRPSSATVPDQGALKDCTRSGLPHAIVHTRSFLVRPQGGEIKLRIVLDRFSVEVFVNDGEQVARDIGRGRIFCPARGGASYI